MRRWCPAVCISSCLSLISILWGNRARLCRLNRCVSLGKESSAFFFFSVLEWDQSGFFSVDVSGFRVRSGYYSSVCQLVGKTAL